jgi:hypothetical protein
MQVFLDHIDPICFLPLVTQLHALIRLPIPYIPIALHLWLVDLLGPAIMSVVPVFPSYMWLQAVWDPLSMRCVMDEIGLVRGWDFVLTFVLCWTITFIFRWTITFVFCWTITFAFCWTTILVFGGTIFSIGHYPLWTYFI